MGGADGCHWVSVREQQRVRGGLEPQWTLISNPRGLASCVRLLKSSYREREGRKKKKGGVGEAWSDLRWDHVYSQQVTQVCGWPKFLQKKMACKP